MSKESKIAAANEVEKLAGQDYFKPTDAILDVLVDFLLEHAENSQHIERMIKTWISRTRQMLHPSDIPRLADETSSEQKRRIRPFMGEGETFTGFDWQKGSDVQ